MALVAIPDEFQVDGKRLEQLREDVGSDAASLDLDRPQRRLTEFAAARHSPDRCPSGPAASQRRRRARVPAAAAKIAAALAPLIERALPVR
ncbi:MAG: hypothetical protein U1E76_09735 [Planctomycetota bacterium]